MTLMEELRDIVKPRRYGDPRPPREIDQVMLEAFEVIAARIEALEARK